MSSPLRHRLSSSERDADCIAQVQESYKLPHYRRIVEKHRQSVAWLTFVLFVCGWYCVMNVHVPVFPDDDDVGVRDQPMLPVAAAAKLSVSSVQDEPAQSDDQPMSPETSNDIDSMGPADASEEEDQPKLPVPAAAASAAVAVTQQRRALQVPADGIIPWEFHNTGLDEERDELVEWWTEHPEAPMGLSCRTDAPIPPSDDKDNLRKSSKKLALQWLNTPPPVFEGRIPAPPQSEIVQVAFVIPFVEFQVPKLVSLLYDHWNKFPPCAQGTPEQPADLLIFTEAPLSVEAQSRILDIFSWLGPEKTGCFHNKKPSFINLEREIELSHLEGAAYSFYKLFELLESKYQAFLLAEPDVAPVQPNWLPALVETSKHVGCGPLQVWQMGSPPFPSGVEGINGMLRQRKDYHLNGNALYALGCHEFEDYKCRVQTHYVPEGDCEKVAGCQSSGGFEGGYDHALYNFRSRTTYEYSRSVLHKFQYSPFLKNLGEMIYTPEQVVQDSPATYFIHSKSIFRTDAATIVSKAATFAMKKTICNVANETSTTKTAKAFRKLLRYARSGEYGEAEVLHKACTLKGSVTKSDSLRNNVCALAAQESKADAKWKKRFPGKTYLWTIDFHGGPTNCDIPLITEAQGVVHSEIGAVCGFYDLCTERLKALEFDDWKGFDPSYKVKQKFFKAYKTDPEFKRVDAFLCHHPAANCELFKPFGKSIIVHATTRLEFGRHDAGIKWRLESGYNKEEGSKKWVKWIRSLQSLAKDKRNIIAANNVYDQHYIKFFTGIEDVELIPSWCGDGSLGVQLCTEGWGSTIASRSWYPTKKELVVVPYRSNLDRTRYEKDLRKPEEHPILAELLGYPGGKDVKTMQELYGNGDPRNMLQHPAVVIVPYQISTMQLVEMYRLNIPMFCPSLRLLKKWCQEYDLMWETQYGWPEDIMPDLHPNIPNPNGHLGMDKHTKEWNDMFDYWMPKSDFYVFPHITYFDSWEHLFEQYHHMETTGGLKEVNLNMMAENNAVRESLVKQWQTILRRVKVKSPQF